jgi:mannosyltransferase
MTAPRVDGRPPSQPPGARNVETERAVAGWADRTPPWTAPALAAGTALAVSLLGITGASFWLDEAATISAVRRPWPDLMRYLEWQDGVHALYYMIMRAAVTVLGTGEFAMRLPTALATAVAAALVAVLGRRYASPLTGLLAGLFYATAVTVTQFAQEARPYAFAGLMAAVATYVFARGIEARGLRWPILYALSVILLGLFNILALHLVPAHAVTLFLLRRTAPDPRGALVRWVCAVVVAGAALAPFALYVARQRVQVAWLEPINDDALRNTAEFLAGDQRLVLIVGVLAALGAMARRGPGMSVSLRELAAPWVVLPVVMLVVVSLFHPVFHTRYLFFTLPAAALLVGEGLAWLAGLGPRLLVAVLVPLAVLTLPEQVELREQDSKLDDLRALARVLDTHAQPGDGILYLDQVSRWDAAAYPDSYRGLVDVTLLQTAEAAANLRGTALPDVPSIADRLRRTPRVWVIDRDVVNSAAREVRTRRAALTATGPYAQRGQWRYKSGTITLLVRTPPR